MKKITVLFFATMCCTVQYVVAWDPYAAGSNADNDFNYGNYDNALPGQVAEENPYEIPVPGAQQQAENEYEEPVGARARTVFDAYVASETLMPAYATVTRQPVYSVVRKNPASNNSVYEEPVIGGYGEPEYEQPVVGYGESVTDHSYAEAGAGNTNPYGDDSLYAQPSYESVISPVRPSRTSRASQFVEVDFDVNGRPVIGGVADSGQASIADTESSTDSPSSDTSPASNGSPVQPLRRPSLMQRLFGTSVRGSSPASAEVALKMDPKAIDSYQKGMVILKGTVYEDFVAAARKFTERYQDLATSSDMQAAERTFEKDYDTTLRLAQALDGLLGTARLFARVKSDADFTQLLKNIGSLQVQDVDAALQYPKGESPLKVLNPKKTISDLPNEAIVLVLNAIKYGPKDIRGKSSATLYSIRRMLVDDFTSLVNALDCEDRVCRKAVRSLLKGETVSLDPKTQDLMNQVSRMSTRITGIVNMYNDACCEIYLYRVGEAVSKALLEANIKSVLKKYKEQIVFLQQYADSGRMKSKQLSRFNALKQKLGLS